MEFSVRSVRTRRGNYLAVITVPAVGNGSGSPVLLVHPINLRKEVWLGVLPTLAADRPCVLVDLAGHGESTDDEFSLDTWIEETVEVVEALGLEAVHLVGGSLGGTIGLDVCVALGDRVLSIAGMGSTVDPVPHETPSPAPTEDADVAELFAGLAREAAPRASDAVVESIRFLTNTHGADVVTRVLAAAFAADGRGLLQRIACPALWMTGELDTTCSTAEGERIAARLGGKHVVLSGVGHLRMVEAPHRVLAELLPHLRAADCG